MTSAATRIRELLQAEARQLATDHVRKMITVMLGARDFALEISEGGDAYPAGVRDLARRYAEETDVKVQTIEAITGRA